MEVEAKMDSDAASDNNLFYSDEAEDYTEDLHGGAASFQLQQALSSKMEKSEDTITETMEMIDTTVVPTQSLEDIQCPDWSRESLETADTEAVFNQFVACYQSLITNILSHSVPSQYKYQEKGDVLDPLNFMKTQDTLQRWLLDIGITEQHYSSWPDNPDERWQQLVTFLIQKLSKSYKQFMEYLKNKEKSTSYSAALQDIFKSSNNISEKFNTQRREIKGAQYFLILYELKSKIKSFHQGLRTKNYNAYSKIKRKFIEISRSVEKFKKDDEEAVLEMNGQKEFHELYFAISDFITTHHQLYIFHRPNNLRKRKLKYETYDMLPNYIRAHHLVHRFWDQRMKALLAKVQSVRLPEPTINVIIDFNAVKNLNQMIKTYDGSTFVLENLDEYKNDETFMVNWESFAAEKFKKDLKEVGLPYDEKESFLNNFRHYPTISRPEPVVKSLQMGVQRSHSRLSSSSMASSKPSSIFDARRTVPDEERMSWVKNKSQDDRDYEKTTISMILQEAAAHPLFTAYGPAVPVGLHKPRSKSDHGQIKITNLSNLFSSLKEPKIILKKAEERGRFRKYYIDAIARFAAEVHFWTEMMNFAFKYTHYKEEHFSQEVTKNLSQMRKLSKKLYSAEGQLYTRSPWKSRKMDAATMDLRNELFGRTCGAQMVHSNTCNEIQMLISSIQNFYHFFTMSRMETPYMK